MHITKKLVTFIPAIRSVLTLFVIATCFNYLMIGCRVINLLDDYKNTPAFNRGTYTFVQFNDLLINGKFFQQTLATWLIALGIIFIIGVLAIFHVIEIDHMRLIYSLAGCVFGLMEVAFWKQLPLRLGIAMFIVVAIDAICRGQWPQYKAALTPDDVSSDY